MEWVRMRIHCISIYIMIEKGFSMLGWYFKVERKFNIIQNNNKLQFNIVYDYFIWNFVIHLYITFKIIMMYLKNK